MMHMTFYWGRQATILFYGWFTHTWLDYGLSLAALFLASMFHEFLVSRRVLVLQQASSKYPMEVPLLEPESPRRRALWLKVTESLLYFLTSGLALLLMLAAMSFNGGVFLSILFGYALGYFIFRSGSTHSSSLEMARETNCC